jgi:acyl carrier protein
MLLALAAQCGPPSNVRSLPLCNGADSDGSELFAVAAAMLRDGYSPDLSPLYGTTAGALQRIPPYDFDTSSRFWTDGGVATVEPAVQVTMVTPVAASEQRAPVLEGREEAVLAVIAAVGGYPVAQLSRSSRLAEDLGYDSLLQFRLVERLRAEYPQVGHVAVAELLAKIHSVGDIVDFVTQSPDRAGATG